MKATALSEPRDTTSVNSSSFGSEITLSSSSTEHTDKIQHIIVPGIHNGEKVKRGLLQSEEQLNFFCHIETSRIM